MTISMFGNADLCRTWGFAVNRPVDVRCTTPCKQKAVHLRPQESISGRIVRQRFPHFHRLCFES